MCLSIFGKAGRSELKAGAGMHGWCKKCSSAQSGSLEVGAVQRWWSRPVPPAAGEEPRREASRNEHSHLLLAQRSRQLEKAHRVATTPHCWRKRQQIHLPSVLRRCHN